MSGEIAASPATSRRVLLKVSGEALMGNQAFGINPAAVEQLAGEIRAARSLGVALGVVIGGGNIFRGLSAAESGLDRVAADHMGMLATVMNALALQSVLERLGEYTRVLSAVPMSSVCEPYIRRRAMRHLEKGRVVLFAAGTGNPFFTTDTAAVLRAVEMGCDELLKGTQVDGIYDADPKTNRAARRYTAVSYTEVLARNLRVMDASAIALARDNGIPIRVFALGRPGSLAAVLTGRGRSTLVSAATNDAAASAIAALDEREDYGLAELAAAFGQPSEGGETRAWLRAAGIEPAPGDAYSFGRQEMIDLINQHFRLGPNPAEAGRPEDAPIAQ